MDEYRLQESILQEIETFPGFVGLSAKNLMTGDSISVNAEMQTATASTIKVPILIELFRQIDAGSISLNDLCEVTSEAVSRGSGILQHFSRGRQFSIRDLVILVAALSDNTAANMLIDLVTVEKINTTMDELGFPRTRLLNRIDFDILNGDINNLAVSTPGELMRLMQGMAEGTFLSERSRAEILAAMRVAKEPTLIGRYLPLSSYSNELDTPDIGLTIANKTGGWVGFRADLALIETHNSRYVISVVIDGDPDTRFWPENAGSQAIGRISRLIFQAWTLFE